MGNNEVCPELIRLLRVQRHDFINHLQVIHALLQLGRAEKALKYIEDLSKDQTLVTNQLPLHKDKLDCKHKTGA